MKFEVLKKSHLKRFIVIGVVVVIIISAIILNFTRAKYRTAQSMPLINGTVNYDLADLNMVAVYIEDESASDGYAKVDTIPTEGYAFNEEMSYCTIDGNRDDNIGLSYDINSQILTVRPVTTTGTKCYLYFDEQQTFLADVIKEYNQSTRSDFSTTMTSSTTNTIYVASDDDGITYYFSGNPTDNWVYFAGFYWRIVRINGDGTIRLIYQGVSTNTTDEGTQIGVSAFNNSWDNNMYVGYMYTDNQVHGLGTDSTIKRVLDEWYQNNLVEYKDNIDINTGFCNDRTLYSGTGIGTDATDYASSGRLIVNKAPTFECASDSDLFTVSGSNKGNGALDYPIGLITADEVVYAGGVHGVTNSNYYLYVNHTYWTMTPTYYVGGTGVYCVYSDGSGSAPTVNVNNGVRPVINLRADVTISSGDGTASNPFVIS